MDLNLKAEDFEAENRIVQLGVPPCRIGILTSVPAVPFEELCATSNVIDIDGLPVRFIGREASLKNNRAVGRSQDIADIEALLGSEPSE